MFEHPVNLAERMKIIRDVFQSVVREYPVNAIAFKWQGLLANVKLEVRLGIDVDIDKTGDEGFAGTNVQLRWLTQRTVLSPRMAGFFHHEYT